MGADLFLSESATLVEEILDRVLPPRGSPPQVLSEAIRYSTLGGGKRFRPALVFAAAESLGGDRRRALPVAAALEMIHTYSLIHDDLPAMDDDAYRRGKLTCHKVFGEGVAILAGDALLSQAFQVLARAEEIPAPARAEIVGEIAAASGPAGMVGGQVMDLEVAGREVDLPTLEYIHSRKTGALIRAAVRSGGLAVGGRGNELECLTAYGRRIGLGFQIIDDILDIEGTPEETGKDTGRDQRLQKGTYPVLLGIEESYQRARKLIEEGIGVLAGLGSAADPLRALARFLYRRRK